MICLFFVIIAPTVSSPSDYSTEKPRLLIFILAFTLVIPNLLIRYSSDLRLFINLVGIASISVTLLALPSLPSVLALGNRLELGEEGNPIWLARAAGIATLWIWFKMRSKDIAPNFKWLLPVSLIVLVATGSRGPLLVTVIVTLFVTAKYYPDLIHKNILSVLTIICISAIIYFNVNWIDENFLSRFGRSGNTDITSGRSDLSKITWMVIEKNPSGVGLGGLDSWLPAKYPHNIILEFMAELGWLAGVSFICLISLTWYRISRLNGAARSDHVLLYSLFLYSLLNALISGDLTSSKELYITISLCFGVSYLKESVNTDSYINLAKNNL